MQLRISKQAKHNGKIAVENKQKLDKITEQTNGGLDRKIKEAVVLAIKDNPDEIRRAVAAEALNDLLTEMIFRDMKGKHSDRSEPR